MGRPQVRMHVTNGNLGRKAPSENGTCVVLVASPVAPTAGYGVPFLVKSKADVTAAFSAGGNAAVVDAFNNGFFAEAPEGTKVYVLAMAQATTLATLLAAANADLALNMADGKARLMSVIKFPSNTYTATVVAGFDSDVDAAVTAAASLWDTWFSTKRKPFRAFIQGYACTNVVADLKDYSATTKNMCAIVLGAVYDSATTTLASARSTLLYMGRAAAIEPQRNPGRIKDGSLNLEDAATVKLGSTPVEQVSSTDMDTLWDKGYVTIERNQIAPGYVFTDSRMLCDETDDFFCLENGRVMDNAVRIAFATYYNELKDDVDVDDSGRLSSAVEKALENAIETAIDADMRTQLSKKNDGTAAVNCLVNPDPDAYAALYAENSVPTPNVNLLSGGLVYVFIEIRPKGCSRNIGIYLGFGLAAE